MKDEIGLSSENSIGKDGIIRLSGPEVFDPTIEAINGGGFPNILHGRK